MGSQNDEHKNKPREELGKEDKDKGVEMSQDFDGDIYDLPPDDENDPPPNPNDEEENGEEEIEREMGDLEDSADIVDEQMWNSDDEDESEKKESLKRIPKLRKVQKRMKCE